MGSNYITKDPDYYLSGGDLHILAERTLFRVHAHFFIREPSVFRKKLHWSNTNGFSSHSETIGSSPSSALVLDVSADDLASFLWVFYNPKYSVYDTTFEHWEAILRLAHDWNFPEVKALSIREIEKIELPVVARVILYEKYEIDRSYLLPLYEQLCTQPDPLTLEDAKDLGMPTIWMIFTAREHLRAIPKIRSDFDMNEETKVMLGDLLNETLRFKESEIEITSPTVKGSFRSNSRNSFLTNGTKTNEQPLF